MASPFQSVEATESALWLLPSMALSSAQLGLIIAAVSRETLLGDWSWSMALYRGEKITLASMADGSGSCPI